MTTGVRRQPWSHPPVWPGRGRWGDPGRVILGLVLHRVVNRRTDEEGNELSLGRARLLPSLF